MEVVGRDRCGSRFGDRSTHVEGLSIRVEDLSMHVLPMHVEVFPRMLIFPRMVVLPAWPWHSHTIFWSCRLVVCPACSFPSSQAIFRCLFVATSVCGFSHFVVLPACGPAALYPPNLRLSQLNRPFFTASSWPISARGLSQLVAPLSSWPHVASHGPSARSLSNTRLPPLVASPEASL